MQIRIEDPQTQAALRASAKFNGRSLPKEVEYLLKLVLGVKPAGLGKR